LPSIIWAFCRYISDLQRFALTKENIGEIPGEQKDDFIGRLKTRQDSNRAYRKSPSMKVYAFLLSLALVALSALNAFAANRPTIVFVSGEFEYHSRETFPVFAKQLEKEYDVKTVVLERPADEKVQSIPGLEQLEQADLLVIMIRRMVLPEEQLNRFKKYLDSGKPLIGLRTASHSFENWKEFDAEVLGGNYQNHHGNNFKTSVSVIPEARENPILRGVTGFVSDGSLYKNTPLRAGSVALLRGTIEGQPPEPVAWTHEYRGDRIFYSSLGHPNDFKSESFVTLMHNAMAWTLKKPLEKRGAK
jgi:type 1 glutamine amidotransferase